MLSNNDGCVIARSNEAKALGIEMGAPWHLHRDRFRDKGVVVRSSNYTLYGDMSARVMKTLAGFTPDVEIYSIDEAFLGLSGFEQRLESHARGLREKVLQWTGIPVSVGIAPTKTLAKIANRFAKKDTARGGVAVLLEQTDIEEALGQVALSDLWGVAGRIEARLTALGITTPLGLRDSDAPSRKRLMRALDAINAEHGRDTLVYASAGRGRAWALKSEFRSPRYTTCWKELLRV